METLLAFILGKNPELSLVEIISYFNARKVGFSIKTFEKEFAIVEINSDFVPDINYLGGTIKICKIVKVDAKIDIGGLPTEKLFNFSKDFLTFGLSFYSVENWKKFHNLVGEYFKKQLRENRIKAGYLHLNEEKSYLDHVDVINKKLLENGEVIVCFSKGKYYIGKTAQVHNPFEFQKRDIKRPAQRPIFSIPPRLAKIMVNLLGIKNGTILDPFCGIGTILQEAALMGFDIRGVDIDQTCIKSAKKNLEWLKKEYNVEINGIDKKIICGNSRQLSKHFPKESIDGIVTEPYLGPPLKGHPTKRQADDILSGLDGLYTNTLSEVRKILKSKGRVCIISPALRMGKFTLSLDIGGICEKTGFRQLNVLEKISGKFPLTDFEDRHKLIREINVLEKTA